VTPSFTTATCSANVLLSYHSTTETHRAASSHCLAEHSLYATFAPCIVRFFKVTLRSSWFLKTRYSVSNSGHSAIGNREVDRA
jgi:hypothetical protein